MTAGLDLQVDTDHIRKAAATLEETGRRFGAAAPGTGPVLGPGALGDDGDTVARLIAARCAQAQQAAEQLGAVASGVAQQLTLSADTFDRLDRGVRWPR